MLLWAGTRSHTKPYLNLSSQVNWFKMAQFTKRLLSRLTPISSNTLPLHPWEELCGFPWPHFSSQTSFVAVTQPHERETWSQVRGTLRPTPLSTTKSLIPNLLRGSQPPQDNSSTEPKLQQWTINWPVIFLPLYKIENKCVRRIRSLINIIYRR